MSQRILVVDDEDVVRGVIAEVLSDDDHQVIEAPNAEEALRLYRAEPFSLVITDIYMGKMTGLDLLKEVKLINDGTLVVVMTSNASLETATTALRSGAYDYLTKPFEDIDLITAVANRALEQIRLTERNRALIEKQKRYAEELEALNARLREMANRDGLTGLFNHRYFRHSLESVLGPDGEKQDHAVSLIFADIDNFKHYNDTNGHPRGDDLLISVGKILDEIAVREQAIAARYGGEEFVIVAPGMDRPNALRVAESIRNQIEEHPFPGRESQPLGRLTISLGVACFPDDGVNPAELIDRADQALYRAKHEGRNAVRLWEPDVAGIGQS